MENDTEIKGKANNLVGIIPISGHDSFDFEQPWPNCMMPIGPAYSLLEAAVVECAYAGCKSIWIVVNDDVGPLIRKTLGNWCGDPVWAWRTMDPVPNESKRKIPIYYTSVNPKDRHKRDCLSWSVIHGALTAFKVFNQLSAHMTPSKYYVSFPHGFFPAYQLREHRKIISSSQNCHITTQGESIKDGRFTSFTFGKEEWLDFRRVIRTGTGRRVPGSNIDDDLMLPPEERWSARYFPPEKVFNPLNIEESHEIAVENYFDIRTWQEYTDFIAASRNFSMRKPSKSILIRGGFNPIASDDQET
jgi:hypothetical protein